MLVELDIIDLSNLETEKHEFHSPYHHGSFDIRTGNPLLGPPRSPLRQVQIEAFSDGTLTATEFLGASLQ